MPDDLDMLDVREVGRELGGEASPLHHSTVYRLIRAGVLRPPIKVAPGISRWPRGDIRELKRHLAQARHGASSGEAA